MAGQATEAAHVRSTQATCTGVSRHLLETIYMHRKYQLWGLHPQGGTLVVLLLFLSRVLSHLLKVNSSQYLEDSHGKMDTPVTSNHFPLGAQCLWGSFLQESQLLGPPLGISVLIAPVILGSRNVGD